LTLKIAQR